MCKLGPVADWGDSQPHSRTSASTPGTSAFTARRLTASTFLIVEGDDAYYEHPFIYVKIVPAARAILLLDTGCGGKTREPDVELTNLREFIERAPVEDNGAKPLNPGGAMRYVVVLSHCHFDHILGVEQFACDSPVLASGYDPTFVAPANLPEHSLCESLIGIRMPSYTPSLRAHGEQILSENGVRMGVVLLHTPGHTPDELALWDEEEAMLYVGDTLYEWEHIVFPKEGSIVHWLDTVDALMRLVQSSKSPEEVKINCGHVTANGPALEVLQTTKAFMADVLGGKEEVKSRLTRRGEEHVKYVQEGGRYSLLCPERLVEEARKALHTE